MVRRLKFHERKLLKKVDFITWNVDNSGKDQKILRRYHIQSREHYVIYNKVSRQIRNLVNKLSLLQNDDPIKESVTKVLLKKLFGLGLLGDNGVLETANKITASSFCRRRLPVIMVKNKLSTNLKNATDLIEQGHIRVGPHMVKDPALLISRSLEDFVTWMNLSKIKKHIQSYNSSRDDFY